MEDASGSTNTVSHFHSRATRGAAASSSSSRQPTSVVIRIQRELQILRNDPVPFIYVRPDESDVTNLTALVVGPLETPYAGGFFKFSIRVVPDYPMVPLKVKFDSTDGGRVRFNPNLYACGKVCLSILGTWEGPEWSSAESLSSVLLSIQSLMCPKPYHNEPGYESNNNPGVIAAYNDYIRYETLRVGVVANMTHPMYESFFPRVSDRLFLFWHELYMKTATEMKSRLQGSSYSDPFSRTCGTYNLDPIICALNEIKSNVTARVFSIHVPPVPKRDQFNTLSDAYHRLTSAVSTAKCRLQDEYRTLLKDPRPSGSAAPQDLESPFLWNATILGPEDTPWEGGIFPVEIRFSYQHPDSPPFAKFMTKMFHPNITEDGIPALDLIQTRWSVMTRVGTILDKLQEFLATPSAVYPINANAEHLYRTDRREYDRKVRRIAQDGC